jgi:hypothetical protein
MGQYHLMAKPLFECDTSKMVGEALKLSFQGLHATLSLDIGVNSNLKLCLSTNIVS